MLINEVLIKPKVTEKSLKNTSNAVYEFEVGRKANKNQIRQAVTQLFNVTVSTVKTIVRKGKKRRVGKFRLTKKLPDKKIAYVTLKSGKIDIFPSQ